MAADYADVDYAEQITGYDEADERDVFGGPEIRQGGGPRESGRRHGRSGLSPARGGRGKSGKPIKRNAFSGIAAGFDPRRLAGIANGLLFTAIAGTAVAAVILYLTFVSGALPHFYGALAAAATFVFLLCYVAAKLLGST